MVEGFLRNEIVTFPKPNKEKYSGLIDISDNS